MKTKKTFANSLLLYGFLAIMILPLLLFFALSNFVDTVNYENRTLEEFPNISENGLQSFPSQFDNYLNDNAPFRNQFMTLNAYINMGFGVVNSSDVLLGKDNWLFLKDVSDSKSISDYQGITAYTNEQQEEIILQVNELQKKLNEYDFELVITFAPAKEGIYSNYMPDYIPVVNEQTRVEQLVQSLQESTNAHIVFPKEELIAASQSAPVYYKYDTHWNEVGAYIAAQQIYKAIEFDYVQNLPEFEPNPSKQAPTDLANISATWNIFNDDIYYSVLHDKAVMLNESADGYITNYSGVGNQSVIIVTDSFGEALAPFLSAQFNQSIAIHGNALNSATLQTAHNTILQTGNSQNYVIIEVAERFSDTLLPKLKILNEYASGVA